MYLGEEMTEIKNPSINKPVALVTGASRGIGKELAKALILKGYEVYGTSRRPQKIPEDEKIPGVKYLKLDLLDPNSIESLISQFKSLDFVSIITFVILSFILILLKRQLATTPINTTGFAIC